jgi:hypothetical protein
MAERAGEQERRSLKRNDDMMGYGSIDIYTPGKLLELLELDEMDEMDEHYVEQMTL